MQPELIILLIALLALATYGVFGGADFGAGVWEFNTALRASPSEKEAIYRAIGPVWEANHVWLIFVLMILWSGFPVAFAGVCRIVFVPLMLTLTGIVFRGAAYAFRSSLKDDDGHRRTWEAVFAFASTAAPFFMGTAIGVLAGNNPQVDRDGQFHGNIMTDWIRPESLFFGFFAVGICVFLAAVFLYRETALTSDSDLSPVWRRRALTMSILVGLMAMAGLLVVRIQMPELWQGLSDRGWPLVLVSIGSGILTILFVWWRRPSLAALTAAITVASVLAAWGVAHYPYLIAPNMTFDAAAAPDNVLWLLLGCIAVGLVLVLPPLWWLLRIFKSASKMKSS
jgi:cytochrome d ubiquinol oxidase subunit II